MKNLYPLALVILLTNISNAQTLLFGGTNGNGDFENGTTGWVFVNGSQTNKWMVGSNATPGFGGSSCIYVSANGSSHSYSTTSPTYSYFYKDVAVPAGTKSLWLIFDYISNGESVTDAFGTEARDALRIWTMDRVFPITAGQDFSNVFFAPASGYYNQNTWKRKVVSHVSVDTFAGSTMRVVFQWFNDWNYGNQPPAALDNIEFYASCQEYLAPQTGQLWGNAAMIAWSPLAGVPGYELRYKKQSEPNTVPSYTNPITIPGSSNYYTILGGLEPSTAYIAEVRAIGATCTEYSAPTFFNTLDAPVNDTCSGAITLPVWSTTQPGTLATFRGSTPSVGLTGTCNYSANNDVWFKFVAQNSEQTIQTNDPDFNESFYSATAITLFTGDCNNLQPVALPCATQSTSVYQYGSVSRLLATGLTVGATYYIRINTNSNTGYDNFNISIYNPMEAPECPELLEPAIDSIVNYGLPYTFRWTKGVRADAYRVRIIQQSGAYTEIYTRDTFYTATVSAGINYTWRVQPFNVLDQGAGCNANTFSTCPLIPNSITISASGSTAKCSYDSVLLKASSGTSIQWYRNDVPIAGATLDSIWAKQPGTYSVRITNGSCFSGPSNTISITNKATPGKPVLSTQGTITICQGSTTVLSMVTNVNNQWFLGSNPIPGANGFSYTTGVAGQYHVRIADFNTGCYNYTDTATVVINPAPPTPTISSIGSTTICIGDSVKLRSNVASGNQWYKDNVLIPNATDTIFYAKQAGSYKLKQVLSNCSSDFSPPVVVTTNTVPAAITITATGAINFCSGDSLKLTSASAANNKWFMNDQEIAGATAQIYYAKAAGSFTARVSENGCLSAASNAIIASVKPLPAKPSITANGFILNANSGYSSYQWYLNDALIAGANTSQHTVLQTGNYKVVVSDASGCQNVSDNFNAAITGINDMEMLGYKISLFPNPITEYVTINVAPNNSITKTFTATVSDIYGKTISVQKLKDGVNKIYMTTLPQGHYFVTIKNGNTVKTIKLMKTK